MFLGVICHYTFSQTSCLTCCSKHVVVFVDFNVAMNAFSGEVGLALP